MGEDARQNAIRGILAEEGASSPNMDLDTLAGRVLKAVDENTAPAGDQHQGDDEHQAGEGNQAGQPGDQQQQAAGQDDMSTGAGA